MPVVTEKLIHIHMPKTGGTWVSDILHRELGGEQVGEGHGQLSSLPPEILDGRTTFGTVRDPWTWYVSLWRHALAFRLDLVQQLGNGYWNFHDALKGWLDPSHVKHLPTEFGIVFPMSPKGGDLREEWIRSGTGLWSWLHHHLYGDPTAVDALVDMARLRDGIEEITGLDLPEERWPPLNTHLDRAGTSDKGPIWAKATDLRQWVWDADGELTEELGYTGPGDTLDSPVTWLSRG